MGCVLHKIRRYSKDRENYNVSGKSVTSSNNHIGRCCWNVFVVQKFQKLDFFSKDDAITPPFHDGLLRL